MADDGFCLKWGQHPSNLLRAFDRLLSGEQFTDVLVAAEGRVIKAHRIVLTAASEYFETLFEMFGDKAQPIVVLKDTCYADAMAIVEFIYKGQVNVPQEQLGSLLRTAENLKIKGLADVNQDAQPRDQDPLECPTRTSGGSTSSSRGNNSSRGGHTSSSRGNSHSNNRGSNSVNGGSSNRGSSGSNSNNGSGSTTNHRSSGGSGALPPPPMLTDNSMLGSPPPPGYRVTSTGELRRKPGRPRNSERGLPYAGRRPRSRPNSVVMGMSPHIEPVAGPSGVGDNSNEQLDCNLVGPTPGGPLTPERIRSLGIVQLNEYMNSGTRQQFWEEPFVKVIMHAIRNKEIDIKRSAELLGCSYGTLYGRYRECFGYIKHAWNSMGRYPSASPSSSSSLSMANRQLATDHETMVFERLREGKINLAQAAVVLGVDPSLLAFQMAERMHSLNEVSNDATMRDNSYEIENNHDMDDDDDDDDNFVALGPHVVLEEEDDDEEEEREEKKPPLAENNDDAEVEEVVEEQNGVNGGSGEDMEQQENNYS